MTNLVKMEWYKLRTKKMFIILAVITFAIGLAFSAGAPIMLKAVGASVSTTMLSGAIGTPFDFGLLMIPMFISAIGFLYEDFAGGYIKN